MRYGYTVNMKNLLLIVMFASTSAASQEFSFDAEAMGKILAGTQALKVKHDGRTRPPLVSNSDYEARHIGFKLFKNGAGGDEGGVYVNKAIEILYKDSHRATPAQALRISCVDPNTSGVRINLIKKNDAWFAYSPSNHFANDRTGKANFGFAPEAAVKKGEIADSRLVALRSTKINENEMSLNAVDEDVAVDYHSRGGDGVPFQDVRLVVSKDLIGKPHFLLFNYRGSRSIRFVCCPEPFLTPIPEHGYCRAPESQPN